MPKSSRLKIVTGIVTIIVIMLTVGCASLNPRFESPSVTVTAFRALPSNTINPKFEIDLHVVNPNSSPLKVQGLSYGATIEGHKIITGVSNQMPEIAAYGEGDVSVVVSANLFGGIGLLTDLMQKSRTNLNYTLKVKLDIGAFLPAIYVEESGKISLLPQ